MEINTGVTFFICKVILSVSFWQKKWSYNEEKNKKIYRLLGNLLRVPSFNPFPKQDLVFLCMQNPSFENTMGKGEIAHNEQFLLIPWSFSTHLMSFLPFSSNLKLFANTLSLEEYKSCCLEKG